MKKHLLALIVGVMSMGLCEGSMEEHFKPCLNKLEWNNQIHGVDYLYLINLDRRPDRLAKCRQQLGVYGIIPYHFSAVDAKTLSLKAINDVGLCFQPGMQGGRWVTHFSPEGNGQAEYDFLRKDCYGKSYFSQWMRRGAIGCTLSHLSCLQDAYTSGYDTIWILEDDIVVKKDPHTMSLFIKKLDDLVGRDHWDILFTDDCPVYVDPAKISNYRYAWRPDQNLAECAFLAERRVLDQDFMKVGTRIRTHSMIVRRSGMQKILEFEKAHHMFVPYDHELGLVPGIQQYVLRETFVDFDRNADSDIQPKT